MAQSVSAVKSPTSRIAQIALRHGAVPGGQIELRAVREKISERPMDDAPALLGAAALCMLVLAWFAQDLGLLLFLGLSGMIMAAALIFLWRLFAWLAKRDGAAHE